MKKTTLPTPRYILLVLIFFAPAILVEGKNEMASMSNASRANSYFSPQTIRKMISFNVSAASVCARTAEIERALRIEAMKAEIKMLTKEAGSVYNNMDLETAGLNRKAFEYAWLGYRKLQKRGILHKTGVLSICDFSQSSSQERLYVIDTRRKKLLYRTYVAHGINSGEEYANSFSNSPESCKSSLGFYVTQQTYYGENGLSLRIDGLDRGFNDQANRRNIVIHGASYVSTRILHKYGVMGTTFGCPAIPTEMSDRIIPLVKNGSCFFIYYPSKKYLSGSTVLNNG